MAELFQVLAPVEALHRLLQHLKAGLPTEDIPVQDALGRILAADIFSPIELPTFPRSNMDGYAVRAQDTFGASDGLPAYLKVGGEVPMGEAPRASVRPGEGVRIPTGAMIPHGADAVVMVEHTQEVDPSTIEVTRPVAPGENVVRRGEDVTRGERLVPKGHCLRPQDVGGLLGVGILTVSVVRRPRVVIIATGDEVVPPDCEPGPGQVRDINTYTIATLVLQAGGIPPPLGIVRGDYYALRGAGGVRHTQGGAGGAPPRQERGLRLRPGGLCPGPAARGGGRGAGGAGLRQVEPDLHPDKGPRPDHHPGKRGGPLRRRDGGGAAVLAMARRKVYLEPIPLDEALQKFFGALEARGLLRPLSGELGPGGA